MVTPTTLPMSNRTDIPVPTLDNPLAETSRKAASVPREGSYDETIAVSYTHLTLPTIYSV